MKELRLFVEQMRATSSSLDKLFYVLFTIGVCYAFICWLMLLF